MRDRLAGVGPRDGDEAYKVRDQAPAVPGAPAGWIPAPPQPAPHPMVPPADGEWVWLTPRAVARGRRQKAIACWWAWAAGMAMGFLVGSIVVGLAWPHG